MRYIILECIVISGLGYYLVSLVMYFRFVFSLMCYVSL